MKPCEYHPDIDKRLRAIEVWVKAALIVAALGTAGVWGGDKANAIFEIPRTAGVVAPAEAAAAGGHPGIAQVENGQHGTSWTADSGCDAGSAGSER